MTTAQIPLLARNGTVRAYATVDAADAEWLNKWSWCLSTRGYAIRAIAPRGQAHQTIYMHREILGLPRNREGVVDHINSDQLDNQRANLRRATRSQNMWNRGPNGGNQSGFKGVFQGQSGRWRARIAAFGRTYHLGAFPSPEQAAAAYDAKAVELHGEFARLNFPVVAQAA